MGLIGQTMNVPGQAVDPMVVRRIMAAVHKILFSPQTAPQIVQMMKTAGNPVAAVVNVMQLVGKILMEKSKGLTPQMAAAAAPQIANEVMALGQSAGLLQASPQLAQQVQQYILQRQKQAPQQAAPQAAPQLMQ